MCADLVNPDRPKWADPVHPTQEEKLAAADGTLAYCGRYEIDVKQKQIVHLPEVATDPGDVGSRQIRPYTFENGRLVIADPQGNIPLWANESGYDPAGLDYLIETRKSYYIRCREQRTLKRGDRVAILGRGIAVAEQVDDNQVHVVLWNRSVLRIGRKQIVWDECNMRWEANHSDVFQTRPKSDRRDEAWTTSTIKARKSGL